MKTLRIAVVASLVLVGACGGNGGTGSGGAGATGTGATGTGATGTGGGGTGGTGTGGGACAKAPASGFTVAVPPSDGTVGAYTAVAQDQNGDPLIAYVWEDPMGQSSDKSTLHFLRWDRCAGAFTAPVTLDTVGDQGFSAPERGAAIAFDPAAGKIAVAYQRTDFPPGYNPMVRVYLVTSTDMGQTWSAPALVSQTSKLGDSYSSGEPSVAIKGSDVWVSYAHSNHACCDDNCGSCTGEWVAHSSDGGATWSYEIVKVGGAVAQPATTSPSELRLDAGGNPGLVYIADDDAQSYNRRVVYYQVGASGGAVVVFDSQNVQNDAPSASLAYDGVKPRVVAHLVAASDADYEMRFSSSDDGVTWGAPVELPRDGSEYTAYYQSLAIGSKGQAAVAAYIGGGSGDNQCGAPRIVRSADLKAWSACGADATKTVAVDGHWVQAYYAPGDELSLVTTGMLTSASDKSGLLFWRE